MATSDDQNPPVQRVTCRTCNGSGRVWGHYDDYTGRRRRVPCGTCNGAKEVNA